MSDRLSGTNYLACQKLNRFPCYVHIYLSVVDVILHESFSLCRAQFGCDHRHRCRRYRRRRRPHRLRSMSVSEETTKTSRQRQVKNSVQCVTRKK